MTKRPSVYLSDDTADFIEKTKGYHGGSRSKVINMTIERFCFVIDNAMPKLTQDQWLALCDVCNGLITDNAEIVTQSLHWNLYDSLELEIKEKYKGVDEEFALKVKKMSLVEKFAIIHVIERFWGNKRVVNENDTYKEILEMCGAKILDQ